MQCIVCTKSVDRYHAVLFPDTLSSLVSPMCFYCLDQYLEKASQSVHRYVLAREGGKDIQKNKL
jgi:hypothetical protein